VGLSKRKKDEQRLVPCPTFSKLVAAEALQCDLCGADLRELPPSHGKDPGAAGFRT
jgi:hypothetical protein